jgi:hypothetical protein
MRETINFYRGGIIMKKTIITLACCALIAPLASAKTHQGTATTRTQTVATEEPITVTNRMMNTTEEGGSTAVYQPPKTLVVLEDRANIPDRYVLNGPGHVVDKYDGAVSTPIQPGTPVRIYYINTGNSRVIDHVVVD